MLYGTVDTVDFVALGVSPSKSHTNIIGYSDNLAINLVPPVHHYQYIQ